MTNETQEPGRTLDQLKVYADHPDLSAYLGGSPAKCDAELQPTLIAVVDLVAAKDARIAGLEARNDDLKDALDQAEQLCRDRADALSGYEMECCVGTANNCAADVASIRAALSREGE